jgi:hypothetical protein
VQSRLRLTLTKPVVALGGEDAPEALRRALKGIGGLDFQALVARMQETAARTYALFRTLIECEADALRSP